MKECETLKITLEESKSDAEKMVKAVLNETLEKTRSTLT